MFSYKNYERKKKFMICYARKKSVHMDTWEAMKLIPSKHYMEKKVVEVKTDTYIEPFLSTFCYLRVVSMSLHLKTS